MPHHFHSAIANWRGSSLINSGFVFLAICFNLLGTALYIRKALRNEIKPNLVTWFLWAFAPYLAFAAQLQDDVGIVSLVTLVTGINPTVIFLVSIRQKGAYWAISLFDVLCGILSATGLVLWLIFQEARYAIGLAILSDLLASVPTYRKSLIAPESETWIIYACLSASALITLATVERWAFADAAFAVYLAFLGTSMTLLILVGSRRPRLSRGHPERWR